MLNEFENRKLAINDFDYTFKKRKQGKDGVSMDQDYFIFYLSTRDVILSSGM
jgi:hypothetical protein